MATESILIHDGVQTVAAADYSNTGGLTGPGGSGQFLAVKASGTTDHTVTLANTGGEQIFGLLQNKPYTSQAADVGLFGISKAVAGAAITTGARLMTDTSGRLITCTSGNFQVAQALEAATAANQIISVYLMAGGGYKMP